MVLVRAGREPLCAPPLLQIAFAGALTRLAHRRKITLAAIGDILTEFETLDLVIDKTPPTASAKKAGLNFLPSKVARS